MKSLKIIIPGIIIILSLTNSINAQTSDVQSVKSEIENAAMNEQNAFKTGDCAQVLELMEADITFLANGHQVPSKKMVEKFCNSVPRPFKTAIVDKLEIYPLTDDTGYAIRTLEYPNDDGTKMQEYVTKIWRKTAGEWKIAHLHSTVKKVPVSE